MENPNRSIFKIQQEYFDLSNLLEETGGELTEELEELLVQNAEDFKKKAESYVGIIKSKNARINLLEDEIKRCQALKKSTENAVDKLETILLNALKLFGYQDKKGVWRYEGATFNLSTRKSDKCNIIGEEELDVALLDRMFAATTSEEVIELDKEIFEGALNVSYSPDEVTEVDFEGEEPANKLKPLLPTETDFINNQLQYSAKFAIRYIDMVKVVSFLQSIGYTRNDLDVDIKIPVKAASAVVKSGTGFRIAKINTDYSLTIK